MKKIFTFMLSAAALLVSVPSWAEYVKGEQKTFKELGLPLIKPDLNGTYFGTICVPQRIVATQGIRIFDVICVDRLYSDSTKVARLVVDIHTKCSGAQQGTIDASGEVDKIADDEPFCQYPDPSFPETWNPDACDGKSYIDWFFIDGEYIDYRMKAGAAYFYQVCNNGADSLADRKIWVDVNDVAAAPVCQNGFYGTFEQTNLNEPVTVLTQATLGEQKTQYLEQVTQVTMPANRGYFKGNFECVPWRWNTDGDPDGPEPGKAYPSGIPNPFHYPCTGEVKEAPRRLSANAIAFNVGRGGNGLYTIDFEHPIYLGKETTNKRIENGQLIIEAADGTKYNAFGQRVK